MIELQFLGPPQFTGPGGPTPIPLTQGVLLAAIIAHEDGWIPRSRLLTLFWPDSDDRAARHNLSQLLYHTKKQPWFDGFEVQRDRVRCRTPTDIRSFRQAVAGGDWTTATVLYQGRFLDGMDAGESRGLEDWLEAERKALTQRYRDAALHLAKDLEDAGSYAEALAHLDRAQRFCPLAEDVLTAVMRCATSLGQRDRALRAYETVHEALDAQGLDPLDTTLDLVDRIQAEVFVRSPPPTPLRRHFPHPPTPFVGRADDLAHLMERMAQPEVRLVTLLGPGGVGKTRLATELALGRSHDHRDGAAFVDLAPVVSADAVPTAIAAAIDLQLSPRPAVVDQLRRHMACKSLMLVVDNAEHLVDAGPLLMDLLDACSNLSIVVTSRQVLDLPGEVVVDVRGLRFGSDPGAPDLAMQEAVAFFVQAATRVDRSLTLGSHADRTAILDLCTALDGLPLGLELAAVWVRGFTLPEIADRVRDNITAIPTAPSRDPRHRGLRAVFDHSWALLSDEERRTLARLSVFRGGFRRAHGEQVAETDARTLLALVNKSLLYRSPEGRFHQHAAVRQSSADKLDDDPTLRQAIERRHARHFAAWTHTQRRSLNGSEQTTVVQQLTEEWGNLATAFDWALAHRDPNPITLFARLGTYFVRTGRHMEGLRWFSHLLAAVPSLDDDPEAIPALHLAGVLATQGGDPATATDYHERSLALADARGDQRGRANALVGLGGVAGRRGDLARAEARYLEALLLLRQLDEPKSLIGTLNDLGIVVRDRGDFDRAIACFDESLALSREGGDLWEIANTTNNRAIVTAYLGDLELAGQLFSETVAAQRQLSDRRGMTMSLNNLGITLMDRGRHDEARTHYREALDIAEDLGNETGSAHIYHNLGTLEGREGNHLQAHDLHCRALRIRHRSGAGHLVTLSLHGLADLAFREHRHARALTLASMVAARGERTGVPLPPDVLAAQGTIIEESRKALGDAQASAARDLGRGLSLDMSIQVAEDRTWTASNASINADNQH